jgi:hypothetical protein
MILISFTEAESRIMVSSISRVIVSLALMATSRLVLAASSNCVELNIPVAAHANNTKFNTVRVDSNVDAVEFTLSREYVTYHLEDYPMLICWLCTINIPDGMLLRLTRFPLGVLKSAGTTR